MQHYIQVLLMVVFCVCLSGCGKEGEKIEKVQDLDYTVVSEEEVPEELNQKLHEKKKEGFKITYEDNGYVYICVGYGEQKSGGYSIVVKSLFLSNNAIYIDTNLNGPQPEEVDLTVKSYPYIVIKTENRKKAVVFQ